MQAIFKFKLNPVIRALAWTTPLWLAACSKAPEAVAPVAPAAPASAVATQVHAGLDWVKPDGASVDAIFAKAAFNTSGEAGLSLTVYPS